MKQKKVMIALVRMIFYSKQIFIKLMMHLPEVKKSCPSICDDLIWNPDLRALCKSTWTN